MTELYTLYIGKSVAEKETVLNTIYRSGLLMFEVVALTFGLAQGTLTLRSLNEAEGKLILHGAKPTIVSCLFGLQKSEFSPTIVINYNPNVEA